MEVLAGGLIGAILLVFFLYISLHPEKIRRRRYFILGWGGLMLIVLSGFFTIGGGVLIIRGVGLLGVGQLLGWVGLLMALAGAAGAVFPGPLRMLESREDQAAAKTGPVTGESRR